jgi:hypothetical protein
MREAPDDPAHAAVQHAELIISGTLSLVRRLVRAYLNELEPRLLASPLAAVADYGV